MAGFNTAVTGLKAATTDLDVTGNNIANSSTIGFKSSRTEFGDIYATAVVGAGSSNTPGSGVTVSDIAQDFSAGTIEFTNNNLDLAINGSGFFQLDDGKGGVTYTRAGAFELDKNGFIVSKSGKYLQGYGLDSKGNRLPIGNLAVTEKESKPSATESIDLSFNIDSREDATKLLQPYDKDEAGSFTYSTTMRSFDSLGNEHTIKFNFVEQAPINESRNYTLAGDPGNVQLSSRTGAVTPTFVTATDFNTTTGELTAAGLTKLASLQSVDERIRTVKLVDDSIADPSKTTFSLEVVFNSSSTGYGDLVINSPAAASITGTSVTTNPSNEVQSFAFNTGAGEALAGDVVEAGGIAFQLGGVDFQFEAGDSIDEVGAEIQAQQSLIIDRYPDVQSVIFNSKTNAIDVTFKAEAGSVKNDVLKLVDTANDVFADGVDTSGNPSGGFPSSVYEGDNSYLGYYRTYAYLNGETQLELGKPNDPGESVTTSDEGPILLKFDPSNGLLDEVNGTTVVAGAPVPKLTIYGADPADPGTTIELDLEGSTQFASASIVKQSQQDGYPKGDLIGVSFGLNGEMIASFSNGENQNLGVVAFATFENQSGLQPSGNTEWTATLTSGDAILNPPGTGLNGTLRSAALEQSNVDLSTELVKLIEAQRNYQANSKTLETLNTVTQAILQI